MALLNEANITREDKERNSIHTEVRATYTVFEEDGKSTSSLIHMGKQRDSNPKRLVNRCN